MMDPAAPQQDQRLITHLYSLVAKEERSELAALRRGLTMPPGQAMEMYRYLGHLIPQEARGWNHDVYYLVASLFALHPKPWSNPPGRTRSNFGASFARLPKDKKNESTEQRFVALLNAHRDDLPDHLRHAVSLLKSRDEVPVDWAQLLRDLRNWDDDRRIVQRAWARSFWAPNDDAAVSGSSVAIDTSSS